MRITNLNPDTDIGASSWRIEIEGHRLLLDAGTHPKREGRASMPLYATIANEVIDAIAITHCHHDHVGTLPVAMRQFPAAHVLMTELSYFMAERVLHNSVNVMVRQRDELGIKEYPLYTHGEIEEAASQFQGFKYNREIEWAAYQKTRAGLPSPTLEFYDAGHTLGSAGIMVRGKKETVFYTGDVCFHDQTLLRAARFDEVQADVLIMETTRGSKEVTPGFTREAEIQRLGEAIRAVLKRKGSVLIPAFALGRTQEILAQLALMMKAGQLERQPIYIGGLGRVFTEIYYIEAHRANRQHSSLKLSEALQLLVLEKNQADNMKLTGGKIFVVTAGMMTEHTAAYTLATRMLEDKRHAIFFVGYADPDTPAGRLKLAEPGDKIQLTPTTEPMSVRCEMRDFDLTAHANRNDMLDFALNVAPKTVVLGHGSLASQQWYADQLRAKLPRVKIFQPGPAETVEC
jgi:Cft2 family RNA processing exonuclease